MENTKIQENIKNTEIQENKKILSVKKSRISQKKFQEAYNKLTEDNKNQINILNKTMTDKFNKKAIDINTHELIHYILNAKKDNKENYSDAWKKKNDVRSKSFLYKFKKTC